LGPGSHQHPDNSALQTGKIYSFSAAHQQSCSRPAATASRRRGNDLGETTKYLRYTTSGAAGNGLVTTAKYLRAATGICLSTTMNYLRGAAGIGLSATIMYLRGTAGIGLGTTIKYLRCTTSAAANSSLGTTAKCNNNWAKLHAYNSWARIQINPPYILAAFVVNSEPRTGARPSVC
jgi:hypothetical protein